MELPLTRLDASSKQSYEIHFAEILIRIRDLSWYVDNRCPRSSLIESLTGVWPQSWNIRRGVRRCRFHCEKSTRYGRAIESALRSNIPAMIEDLVDPNDWIWPKFKKPLAKFENSVKSWTIAFGNWRGPHPWVKAVFEIEIIYFTVSLVLGTQ